MRQQDAPVAGVDQIEAGGPGKNGLSLERTRSHGMTRELDPAVEVAVRPGQSVDPGHRGKGISDV